MFRKASKSATPAAHERWSIHNFRLRFISPESAAKVPVLQDALEALVIFLTKEECYLQHRAQWPLLACRKPHSWLHPGQLSLRLRSAFRANLGRRHFPYL